MSLLCRSSALSRRAVLAAFAAVSLTTVTTTPADAQWPVFDSQNFHQNLLIAARTLRQIDNQITSLQNQNQMLNNQHRNLASLPYSSLQQLTSTIQRTQLLLSQAEGIRYSVTGIQSQFRNLYPQGFTGSISSAQLIADAQSRWSNSLSSYQDSLKTQAVAVGNLSTARTQVSALVASSQNATGALQATQAGNQLLALQSQQLADLTAVLAAQGRAASLQYAQTASGQDQAREQLQRFLTPGAGYQATTITMFH